MMLHIAQFREARPPLPEMRIPPHTRRETTEIQLDLETLLGAAVIEQALFFRSIRAELLEAGTWAYATQRPATFSFGVPIPQHAIERIARLLAAARLLGAAQIRTRAGLQVPQPHPGLRDSGRFSGVAARKKPGSEFAEVLGRVPPAGAIEFLRKLNVFTRRQWEAAIASQRDQAFRIAGVNQKAALESMRELIARSLESGLSPQQFQRAAQDLLRNFQLSPSRLRTVWNTNVGQALARGREEELRDPAVAAILGFRLFDAMNDQFTRFNHAELDGAIAPASWWDAEGAEFKPLLGFNCRCVLLAIPQVRAEKLLAQGGIYFDATQGVPSEAGPDAGFRSAA